nr:immunoglobulin heavy chain junction region [Macaca mulatta]MOX67206.1 immunoglobulin heavy chain junction region [Macaca mulatta]
CARVVGGAAGFFDFW